MLWLDTANDILKIRNAANNAWIDWITQAGTPLIPDGTVGAPGLAFASETDSGLYRIAANTLGVATSGTERIEIGDGGIVINEGGADSDIRIEGDNEPNLLVVDAGNDRIGIGDGAPGTTVEIHDAEPRITVRNTTEEDTDGGRETRLIFEGEQSGSEISTLAEIEASHEGTGDDQNGQLLFSVNGGSENAAPTERMRLDSTGNVLIGTQSSAVITAFGANARGIAVASVQPVLGLEDTEGTTRAQLGLAENDLYIDNQNAGFTRFATSNTERMRITSGGLLLVNTTSTDMINNTSGGGCVLSDGGIDAAASAQNVFNFNRSNSDGTIGTFRSQGSSEGSVSISGSTCSFNGGHLSRWTQLAGGAARIEILRGSVLSNLDEMCVWTHAAQPKVLYTAEDELPEGTEVGDVKTPKRAAYTENNEQLNRMKVSDVEGDINVSGVFQCWDDDDDAFTNDFFCAMTGDFVIRIAEGTTVARGDLLMSAGDGTAKPQDDDIIRSKTIAKVTSTVVSTTHADGSYCVPCVLMAC